MAVKYGQRFAMAWGGLMFILYIFFAGPAARIFNDDPAVVSAIVSYLLLVSVTYGPLGVSMLSGATFNALNKPRPSETKKFK